MEVKWPISWSGQTLYSVGPSWETMQQVRIGRNGVCVSVCLHYNNQHPSKP